jgi:hypothetical protein
MEPNMKRKDCKEWNGFEEDLLDEKGVNHRKRERTEEQQAQRHWRRWKVAHSENPIPNSCHISYNMDTSFIHLGSCGFISEFY